MSFEAKVLFSICVLAIVIPMAVVVIRGEPFDKPKLGDSTIMPPSGPSINIDGGS